MQKRGSVLLYVHRNRNGKPRTATSTFTQLLNSVKMCAHLLSLYANLRLRFDSPLNLSGGWQHGQLTDSMISADRLGP